jgi:cation diffusion facilitator family transporter
MSESSATAATTLDDRRRSLLRRGFRLEVFTVAYNVVEALVSVAAGWLAGSIALIGFGLDSTIEVIAAVAVGHRLLRELRGDDSEGVNRRERQALLLVGITFFLLSAYVVYEAGGKLLRAERPEPSLVGIVVASLSLLLMPLLGWMKYRTGAALSSKALMADAKETFVCSYLSLTLLAGLLLNAWLGWWWADPAAALVMVPFLLHEGWEAVEESREEDEDDD